jgi:flagellar motor switch protein FliM
MSAEIYDFRKPGRLANDLEQRMKAWLRGACRVIPDRWAKHMPFRVELSVRALEVLSCQAALARLPDALVGYRIVMGTESSETLLLMPRPLALALITALVGDTSSTLPDDRELTVVEESLCDYLVQQLVLPILQETWLGRERLTLKVAQKELNPKFARVIPPDVNVLVCSFTARGPFGEQEWAWIVPQKRVLELFADSPSQVPDATQEAARRQRMESLVRELPVEITVTLGQAELPLSSLARLHAGDLIILNQRVSEPLAAAVAQEKRLRVWPGRIGARQAVQIASLAQEG